MPQRFLDSFEISDNDYFLLHQLELKSETVAIAIPRRFATNNPVTLRSSLYCFDDSQSIETYLLSICIRNDFKYRKQIKDISWKLFESGLFVKWSRDISFGQMQQAETPELWIPLRLSHIYGSIFLFVVSTCAAVGTFLLELLVSKVLTRNKPHKIWLLLESFVEGHRHYYFYKRDRTRKVPAARQ